MALVSDNEFAVVIRVAPLAALDIVLRGRDDRILLGRRLNEPAKGCLFVPGGVIRKNERLAQAFSRILGAETGLTASLAEARLLGGYEHLYPTNRFGDPEYGTHYVVQAYELRLQKHAAIRLDSQHSEFRWMSPSEALAASDVHENVKAYLR